MSTKSKIQTTISQNFEELQQVVNNYEKCRKVNEFVKTFDFEEWKLGIDETNEIAEFKEKLHQLHTWSTQIN